MSDYRITYAVAAEHGELPEELAPHVIARVATQLRERADRYHGAQASRGAAVLSASPAPSSRASTTL